MSWTAKEIQQLRNLVSRDKFFVEIADVLKKKPATVRWKAKKLGIAITPKARSKMGKWNTKHAHLREEVFKYFLTHSWEETRIRFSLSESEIKSLFTVGYRDPKLAHLRKDKRRHDSWDTQEIKFMLQSAGIQPRKWISRKVKRGGVHAVKESLSRLNVNSKHLNGMPYSWAQILFKDTKLPTGIKTKAGPSDLKRSEFRFKIIPWVQCEELIQKNPNAAVEDVKSIVRSMAMFQRWIFGSSSTRYIVQKIKNKLKER